MLNKLSQVLRYTNCFTLQPALRIFSTLTIEEALLFQEISDMHQKQRVSLSIMMNDPFYTSGEHSVSEPLGEILSNFLKREKTWCEFMKTLSLRDMYV